MWSLSIHVPHLYYKALALLIYIQVLEVISRFDMDLVPTDSKLRAKIHTQIACRILLWPVDDSSAYKFVVIESQMPVASNRFFLLLYTLTQPDAMKFRFLIDVTELVLHICTIINVVDSYWWTPAISSVLVEFKSKWTRPPHARPRKCVSPRINKNMRLEESSKGHESGKTQLISISLNIGHWDTDVGMLSPSQQVQYEGAIVCEYLANQTVPCSCVGCVSGVVERRNLLIIEQFELWKTALPCLQYICLRDRSSLGIDLGGGEAHWL